MNLQWLAKYMCACDVPKPRLDPHNKDMGLCAHCSMIMDLGQYHRYLAGFPALEFNDVEEFLRHMDGDDYVPTINDTDRLAPPRLHGAARNQA